MALLVICSIVFKEKRRLIGFRAYTIINFDAMVEGVPVMTKSEH